MTVNSASKGGLQTGHGKGDWLIGHPTANEQTKGKENLGEISNYLQWKTGVLSDKKSDGNS